MQKMKEFLPYILIIVVVILIRTFLVTPIMVNGSSMDKTLADGEVMLLNKLGKIEREKIVVISDAFEGEDVIIKRIIGLPGEKIRCHEGIIYINDEKYDDNYAFGMTSDFDEVTLKDNEYFVLGDNRLVSKDSRQLGPVDEKYLVGTTNLILFPFNKLGTVDWEDIIFFFSDFIGKWGKWLKYITGKRIYLLVS